MGWPLVIDGLAMGWPLVIDGLAMGWPLVADGLAMGKRKGAGINPRLCHCLAAAS